VVSSGNVSEEVIVHERHRTLAWVPVAAVVAALVLAACGGGSSKSATASTTTTTAARGSRLAAFRQCMASHGVTVPTRPPGQNGPPPTQPGETTVPRGQGGGFGGGGFFRNPPAGVDPQAWNSALQACQSTIPQGGFGGGANASARAAYRNCLASHGVAVPTTSADPNAPRQGLGSLRDDPNFASANQTCAPLLPNFNGGSGGPATTTAQ
jgi:hypothetical protein